MNNPLSETAIVRALAHAVCQRLTRKLIAALQKLNDGLLSGDGSGLKNTWDEICVQVQFEQSFFWDVYDQTVRQMVETELEKLPDYEREAIWLQTDEGNNWEAKDDEAHDSCPVYNPDIVQYFVKEYLYHEAGKWENQRIRDYQDRTSSSD